MKINHKINSVYNVTFAEKGNVRRERITVEGYGQRTISQIRKLYPKNSRFVLTGFMVDDVFKKLLI